jgi:hypothetical protein
MSSAIDPTVIRNDQKVAKSDLREQFQVAKDEITALQQKVSLARRTAFESGLISSL